MLSGPLPASVVKGGNASFNSVFRERRPTEPGFLSYLTPAALTRNIQTKSKNVLGLFLLCPGGKRIPEVSLVDISDGRGGQGVREEPNYTTTRKPGPL
jgi:hypothetical protein